MLPIPAPVGGVVGLMLVHRAAARFADGAICRAAAIVMLVAIALVFALAGGFEDGS